MCEKTGFCFSIKVIRCVDRVNSFELLKKFTLLTFSLKDLFFLSEERDVNTGIFFYKKFYNLPRGDSENVALVLISVHSRGTQQAQGFH